MIPPLNHRHPARHETHPGHGRVATGGLIAHLITNIPGSSDVFRGSIVSYSNEIKMKLVGSNSDIRKIRRGQFAVAAEMSSGGRKASASIFVWRIPASPARAAPPPENRRVILSRLSTKDGTVTQKHLFTGSRDETSSRPPKLPCCGCWIISRNCRNSRLFFPWL